MVVSTDKQFPPSPGKRVHVLAAAEPRHEDDLAATVVKNNLRLDDATGIGKKQI